MVDGLLLVLSEPGAVDEATFHDWYDTEHAPARTRLAGVDSGVRLRAADGATPTWAAAYEIELSVLDTPAYRALRERRSDRERAIMARLATLDRRVYALREDHRSAPGDGALWILTSLDVQDGREAELDDWYLREHLPLLHAIPGWLRTRRYLLADGDAPQRLALHELAGPEPLHTPGYRAATSTPWRSAVMAHVLRRERRVLTPFRSVC